MRLQDALSIGDLERLAQKRLPRVLFECIGSGVEDEQGVIRNETAFHKHQLLAQHLVDVSKRDQSTTIFGRTYAGNPKGRLRRRRRELPYEVVLGQEVIIRENGRERRVTAAEAFVLQLIKRFATDRSDQPLGKRVLPRRARGNGLVWSSGPTGGSLGHSGDRGCCPCSNLHKAEKDWRFLRAGHTVTVMVTILCALVSIVEFRVRSRASLELELIALRHQVTVLRRQRPGRPQLSSLDRLLWVWLYRIWPQVIDAMVLVKPATVVQWHRKGFGLYWRWRSRRPGRPKINTEIRDLIRRMSKANPLWGAPRIHGELLKLGIKISQVCVPKTSSA